MMGNYQDALEDANEVLRVTQNEILLKKYAAHALMVKGTCLSFVGDVASALADFEKASNYYKELDDHDSQAKALLQIGLFYKNRGEFKKSYEYLRKSYHHFQLVSNLIWETSVLNSLGVLAHICCDFQESLTYFEKAMNYAHATKNRRTESYILASIGDLYQDLGAVDESIEAYCLSKMIANETRDKYLMLYDELSILKASRGHEVDNQKFSSIRSEIVQSQNKTQIQELKNDRRFGGFIHTKCG